MRLGLNMPLLDFDGRPVTGVGVAERARMMEAAGIDSIWSHDSMPSMSRPDPLMLMLTAALATEHVEVGTCIFVASTRNPFDTAQRFLTLEEFVPGRFTLGIGAGSGKYLQDILDYDFDERFARLHQHMGVVWALLDGALPGDLRPDVTGRSTMPNPRPPQHWGKAVGRPRFVLGAWHSDISLKHAIAEYDGWMCSAGRTSFSTMSEAIKRYRDLGGQRAMVASILYNLEAPTEKVPDDDFYSLFCQPEDAAERLQRLADLGFDDVLLVKQDYPRTLGLSEADVSMEDLELLRSLLPRDTSPL